MASAGEVMGVVGQGVGKAMQQVGPGTLLAIAFIAGVLASRRGAGGDGGAIRCDDGNDMRGLGSEAWN
jgi:hypothetical protein